MKKLEMDISPLDDAIADVEETLQSIEFNDLSDYDEVLFEHVDFSILDSNEEIQQELTGLSTLMSDLEQLLYKELKKVEAAQKRISEEDAEVDTSFVFDTTDEMIEPLPSRKAYRTQEIKIDKKNKRNSRL